jgi:hypothetical protein
MGQAKVSYANASSASQNRVAFNVGLHLKSRKKKKKNQKQILPALNIPWALLYHECKY